MSGFTSIRKAAEVRTALSCARLAWMGYLKGPKKRVNEHRARGFDDAISWMVGQRDDLPKYVQEMLDMTGGENE